MHQVPRSRLIIAQSPPSQHHPLRGQDLNFWHKHAECRCREHPAKCRSQMWCLSSSALSSTLPATGSIHFHPQISTNHRIETTETKSKILTGMVTRAKIIFLFFFYQIFEEMREGNTIYGIKFGEVFIFFNLQRFLFCENRKRWYQKMY